MYCISLSHILDFSDSQNIFGSCWICKGAKNNRNALQLSPDCFDSSRCGEVQEVIVFIVSICSLNYMCMVPPMHIWSAPKA